MWHGHSCFEINGSSTLVVDPHDGKSIGIKAPLVKADMVMITHDHFDHNCSRVVKGDFIVIKGKGERVVDTVRVRGIEACHDEVGGEKRGAITIFRWEMDGLSFCHCGDLGHQLSPEQVDSIKPVDILFVPVGGVITIDGEGGRKVVEHLEPRIVIPMHFRLAGLSMSIKTLDEFLGLVDEGQVLRVGNEVEIFPEDIPGRTEYWVFSL